MTENRVTVLSAEIIRFGKIKNLKLDFSKGLNVIYGFNEAGKSTILRFFKVMFYGAASRRKSGDVLKEREIIVPWGETGADGILNILFGNKIIEIRRSFGRSASDDTVCAIDSRTGNKIDFLCIDDLGRVLFGLSKDAFLRTAMISQSEAVMCGKSDEIIEKLMNLNSTGLENISADSAIEKLTARANALKRDDRRQSMGLIDTLCEKRDALIREKYDLKTQLYQSGEIGNRTEEAKKELAEVRVEIQKIDRGIRELNEVEVKAITDSTDAISEYDNKISALKNDEKYILGKDLTKEICLNAVETENTSKSSIDRCGGGGECRNKPFGILCVIATIFLVGISVTGLFSGFERTALYTLFGLSAVLAAISVILIKKESKNKHNTLFEQDERHNDSAYLFERYKVKNSDELMRLYIETKSIRDTIDSLSEMRNRLYEKNKVDLSKKKDFEANIKKLQQELKQAHRKELELVSEIKSLESKMAYEVKITRIPSDIDTEINAVKDEIRKAEEEYRATVIARAVIAYSADEMKRNFAPLLNNATAEILRQLNSNIDTKVRISDNFSAVFAEKASFLKAEYLSRGAYEQLYFALRYALSEILCLNSPFFADDILSVYDDKRTDSALNFMSKQDRQIFLFTCKGFETENAKEFGANIIYIN